MEEPVNTLLSHHWTAAEVMKPLYLLTVFMSVHTYMCVCMNADFFPPS